MHVLDVNHGSATLIVTPSGEHAILVDAGPRGAGYGAILPALDDRSFSFRAIDLMIITHYDADHIGGADEVIEAVPVDRLLDHGDHDHWLEAKGVQMEQYDAAMRAEPIPLDFDITLDGVRVQCLASNNQTPFDTTEVAPDYGNDNPNSVALLVSWEGFEIYIAGDQTGSTEERLVDHVPDVDVFIMNHHGSSSKGSNSATLLNALRPEVAIASMGEHKGHQHPHHGPVDELVALGADVYITNANEHSVAALSVVEDRVLDNDPSGYDGAIVIEVDAETGQYTIEVGDARALPSYAFNEPGGAPENASARLNLVKATTLERRLRRSQE
ncbi:MAG: beta-lactamase superfamily II metal-dependent hydrolase [Myxococcota bacterium]